MFSAQQWMVEGRRQTVGLTLPGQGRSLPVVVYLPGLGENEQAGLLWRQAWARAGYAVLSVQPLDEDANAWASELARMAEFRQLSQQRHAALPQRLARLTAVLAEARTRAAVGDVDCARLDFSRMAVAGYDLGAQGAMALAGEREAGAPAPEPRFRAALLLSPVVAPGQDRAERFVGVSLPLLVITGTQDDDPTNWVSSADQRRRPFDWVPPGDKLLMVLDGATHTRLAGLAAEPRDGPSNERSGRQGGSDQAGRGDGRNGGRGDGGGPGGAGSGKGRSKGGAGGGSGRDANTDKASPGDGGDIGARTAGRETPPAMRHGKPEHDLAVATVSVAFLDVHLRQQASARNWLADEAPTWLQGLALWRQR